MIDELGDSFFVEHVAGHKPADIKEVHVSSATVLAHLKKVLRASEHLVVFLFPIGHTRDFKQAAATFCGIETLAFLLIGFLIMG